MLTLERLKEVLTYDEETGEFYWAKTRGGAHKGKLAGEVHRSSRSQTSYIRIEIDDVRYFAHNLAWFWVYGRFSQQKLDHKDRSGLNNRLSNLREASGSQNKFNSDVYKNNTSGYSGISRSGNGKWKVELRCKGKHFYLGVFDYIEDAVEARAFKAKELFGEFA